MMRIVETIEFLAIAVGRLERAFIAAHGQPDQADGVRYPEPRSPGSYGRAGCLE